jgi:DNA polymerase III epsilon subunit-like protein
MHTWKRGYVAIDTETSGLMPGGRLLEVAAVRCDAEGRVLGKFEAIVCPDDPQWMHAPYAEEALAVNDLDVGLVMGGINVRDSDFWRSLLGFIRTTPRGDSRLPLVVAHVATFDVGMIHKEFHHAAKQEGLDASIRWPTSMDLPICTVGCDLLLRPDAKVHTLLSVAERWGVERQGPAHRAIGDALTCAKVFAKMMPELPDLGEEIEERDPFTTLVALVDDAVRKWRAAKQASRRPKSE